jgi:hypothetical protein
MLESFAEVRRLHAHPLQEQQEGTQFFRMFEPPITSILESHSHIASEVNVVDGAFDEDGFSIPSGSVQTQTFSTSFSSSCIHLT